MQRDMPSNPTDPFQGAHKAAERKSAKDAAQQEITSRDARILAREVKRKQPKAEQHYIYSGPFYR